MTGVSAADRLADLDNWARLAGSALAVAAEPGVEPGSLFRKDAEWAASWAWPRPTDARCRALQALAKTMALTGTGAERAVLAGPLRQLALSVNEAVEAARPPAPRTRADIEG